MAQPSVMRESGPANDGTGTSAAGVLLRVENARTPLRAITVGASSCVMPCSLQVPVGLSLAVATGDLTITQPVNVPARGGTLLVQPAERPLTLAGGMLIPLGVILAVVMPFVGAMIPPDRPNARLSQVVLWPVLGGGMLLTGVSLVVVDGSRPGFRFVLEPTR